MADKTDKSTSKKDLHAEGLEIYKIAVERDNDNRVSYEADIKFARLGEQWPEEVRRQREQEGRPCLTVNRMPAFIRQVTNDARQNKPSIKFHAVGDDADEWTAKVLDGLARNIEYSSNADVAYDTALDNAVSGGFGYFRITTEYAGDDVFDQDIRIERVANSLSVVPDAYCMDADSANWDNAFVEDSYSLDAFKAKWPKAETDSFEGDGKDVAKGWWDGKEVRIAEWWTRREVPAVLLKLSNGMCMHQEEFDAAAELFEVSGITIAEQRPTKTMKVTQHIMNGCEIIETNEWAGKFIPIVPVYGDEVIIEGKRHLLSLIHFAKDPQVMMNYWRTVSTELVAMAPKAPYIGPVGSFNTDPNWQTANTVSHPYLEYDATNGGPPQRQFFDGPPAGALQEAMNASEDMKATMGLFDASLGAKSNESSGRAILARQREGDVSTFHFSDNLSRAIRHTGRIISDLIPKVYSSARIIRTIREDGSNQNVAVNQPTQPTPEEQKAQQEQDVGIQRIYDLTTGKYDVTCESGPSYTTKREEAAAQMTEFMRAVPQAGGLIGDLLAKNLDWPGADEIADRLKLMLPPQAQGKNPALEQAQQQIQQMQQALQQAQQQLADATHDKQVDADKLQIDAYKAETDRLKVMAPGFGPNEVQAVVMQTIQQVLSSPDVLPGPPPQQMPMQQAMPEQPQQAPPEQMMQPEQPQPPDGGFFTPEGFQQ
ncbi:Portal protein [Janthinobacterium sp. CG23_2]|nr:Portal protein [Janthinobacterium sp. CG23_2]CUU26409.1 Portal protein [Janthinobacterium sp. CG23_2]